jgi:hypothetical protein
MQIFGHYLFDSNEEKGKYNMHRYNTTYNTLTLNIFSLYQSNDVPGFLNL